MSAAVETSAPECDWPTTNCYIDAWMQVLGSRRLDPIAGLGVTVTQDYEGDQFTFFKYLHEDLELLYGIVVGELSIYLSLEEHLQQQVKMGRLALVEVDGYYLPDTRATSYRTQHTKTTIAVDSIEPREGRLGYYHNIGHYELTGEDYAGTFRKLPSQRVTDDVLPPYVEFVKFQFPPLTGAVLRNTAVQLLRRHLWRRPDQNPMARFRGEFPLQLDWLMSHPDRFHDHAFNNFRQLGANYELLARHINWLQESGLGDLAGSREAALAISSTAKAMQFKVARAASKGRPDPCDAMFDTLEQNYERVISGLERAI